MVAVFLNCFYFDQFYLKNFGRASSIGEKIYSIFLNFCFALESWMMFLCDVVV